MSYSIDPEQAAQAAIYLTFGMISKTEHKKVNLSDSDIGQLSELDEGSMSLNSALARISNKALDIAYSELCPDEPANDKTVFEDLMGEDLPNALTESCVLELLRESNHPRNHKWRWMLLFLKHFVTRWHEGEPANIEQFIKFTWEKRYRVDLEYFKPSGKFYAEGCFFTNSESWLDVRGELEFQLANHPPGLQGFNEDYMVYMNSEDHPMAFPIIRNPKGN